MDRDKAYIAHILDEITALEEFTVGISFEALNVDRKTRRAVERSFEIIGEAVKNLSEHTRNQYPTIPWKSIMGIRDKIIHHYFDVDYDTLWDTIKYDLPILKKSIQSEHL